MAGVSTNSMTAESSQRDTSELLREALQQEIERIQGAVDSFSSGKTPKASCQIQYADHAASLLAAPKGQLQIKIKGTLQTGEDTIWEGKLSLQHESSEKCENKANRQALLARLALYYLMTRGRLTKVAEKKGFINIDNDLYCSEPHVKQRDKRLYLETNQDIRTAKRVRSLGCSTDPEWSLRVLQVMAPHVEEIGVDNVGLPHLRVLGTMPRLRRLKIWHCDNSFDWDDFGPFSWEESTDNPADPTKPVRFEEIPASHTGLVWLKVDLPRHVVLPLLAQHHRTLRELVLHVELPVDPTCLQDRDRYERQWSWHCNDLPERLSELVQRYPMPALRLVELWRISKHYDDVNYEACVRQQRAVRKVLGPGVEVRCCRCG